MPRKPRGVKKKSDGLSDGKIMYLLRGWALDGIPTYQNDFEAKWDWPAHQDYVMGLQTERPSFLTYMPFKRPWAWWQFEQLPEPRRYTDEFYGWGPNGWGRYPAGTKLERYSAVRDEEEEEVYLRRHPELWTNLEKRIADAEKEKNSKK